MKITDIKIQQDIKATKLQQLVDELILYIQEQDEDLFTMPSVNALSNQLSLSRDTVFKAYKELKRRGLVDSTPAKGYFPIQQNKRVLMMLDYYSPFKDVLFEAFESVLPDDVTVELIFHHYNEKLFNAVVNENYSKYSHYIIMNIDSDEMVLHPSLLKIPSSKLLMLDIPILDWQTDKEVKRAFVFQNFDTELYRNLVELTPTIKKYKTFHIIFPDTNLKHPRTSVHSFNRFCSDYGIDASVISDPYSINIEKNHAYFVLRRKDLYTVLSQCKEKNIRPGKDIGILMYNDAPLYEFIGEGITTLSTDFVEMGRQAAQFVKENSCPQIHISTKLNNRKSI